MNKTAKYIAIIAFFLFAILLYFYKLSDIPPGIYIDEASPVYNAYSLLVSGKDEYGKSWPLLMRFTGQYVPPLYTYLTILPIKLFGLSIFSARFIASLSGLLLVAIFYLWTREVTTSAPVRLFSSFIFAISPWSVIYARTGCEITLGLLLVSSGLLFVWKGINKPILYIPGLLLLSLSIYASFPARFSVPLILIALFLVFRKKIPIIALAIATIVQLPNIYIFTTAAFRLKSTLLSSDALGLWVRNLMARYITYFSPESLFFLPDPDLQRSIPQVSVFFFWVAIPYVLGLYILLKNLNKPINKLISILLFLSPIPASFTADPFSTYRAEIFLLPACLVVTLGLEFAFKRLAFLTTTLLVCLTCIISLVIIARSYFVLLAFERTSVWQEGVDRLAKEIQQRPNSFFVIDQSRQKPLYITLAFFLQLPPDRLQSATNQKIKDDYYSLTTFNQDYNLGNFQTRAIDWENDIYKEQILVGDELAISQSQAKEHFLTQVFEIRDVKGNLIFVGFNTNPAQKIDSQKQPRTK